VHSVIGCWIFLSRYSISFCPINIIVISIDSSPVQKPFGNTLATGDLSFKNVKKELKRVAIIFNLVHRVLVELFSVTPV
jgi:hypothetical protein